MVDMGKVKIKKKIYRFEMRRRYQYENHYKILERPPIEMIKDELKKLFAPKKEKKKVAAAPLAGPSKPPGGFNFSVLGAAVLIALIVLGLGWLYLSSMLESATDIFEPPLDKPVIINTLVSGEILNSGELGSKNYRAAVMVEYNTSNIDNYTVILRPYKEKIPSEVYVLNSARKEASIYPDFIRELRNKLGKRQMVLNEISLKQLESVPEGAIVIVPSGVVPMELLGYESSITMENLADRGIVVIYIGQPFTQMLNTSLSGSPSVFTPQEKLRELPVLFDETNPGQSTENFSLYQPLYRVTGVRWDTLSAYGSVSIVKKGDGAFLFLPQTLDGGWSRDPVAAAEDISRVIFEVPWAEPLAEPVVYSFVNQSNYSATRYFFTETFQAPEASVKVDFIGNSSASNFPVQETLYMHLAKPTDSDFFIQGGEKVIPTNLTNDLVRLNAELKEPEPGQPNMYIIFIDEKGSQVQDFPQGNIDIQSDRSFDVPVYVDRGEYLVKLIDDESQLYAQTYMKVVSIDVKRVRDPKEVRSKYTFEITMDGNPVTLDQVDVVVNDGEYGRYNFSGVSKVTIDMSKYTGSPQQRLPDGNHSFEFTSAGLKSTVVVEHITPPNIFTQPIFWVVALLTMGIVGIGAYFARQEEVYFSLDVPDFPPVARTRIPLSQDVVLSMFPKINENYRWEYTPLTTAEIKNAFKEVFYKGKPIYITDYNVEYLLEALRKKGLVGEALEYYGLTEWENKTKHSTDYLALMRRLRDMCVNNAVPFTGLGESKEADSVITVVGQQMYLHFYEKDGDVKHLLKRALGTIGTGITILVFKSHGDKEAFKDILNSSPTIAPLIMKMESDSKSLLLYTSDELEQMVVDFKSM